MIDGYKILHLPVNIDELLNNDLLLFPLKVSERDGEILDKPRHAEYWGQIFTLKNNNVRLKGSLHKYHNNGLHNYNDFYFTELKNVIFDLCYKFNITPEITEFNNLEFGVNILIPVKVEEFLKSVINYKGTAFHKFNIRGAKGIECEKDHFIIKIYDKGLQYNRQGNLLRFEIKVISMQYFKDNGVKIKTIADLLNITELFKLKDILRGVFDRILVYDNSIKETKLNAKERLNLSNGRNSTYWENLIPNSNDFENGNDNPEYKRQRKKYYRELDNFKKLLIKYSTATTQKDISILIEKKYTELLNIDNEKRDKLIDILEPPKTTEKGQINILNIVGVCPVEEEETNRICLSCKKDISTKKKGAKYCSKKCKNDYTNPLLNPKNNLKKRIEKIRKYPVLFNTDTYLMLSVIERQIISQPNSIFPN